MSDSVLDDELLAAPGVEPQRSTPDDRPGWDPSQGYTDSRRIIRCWVDEQTRHIERVKLSTRWRERLGGRSLEDAVMEALFFASMRFDTHGPLEKPEIEPAEVGPFETFEQLMEQYQTTMERYEELAARDAEDVQWADFQGEKAEASIRGRVTVRLSLAGVTEHVAFDRNWLTHASPESIADHLLAAHRVAYERYEPPTFVAGEHEQLAAELAGLAQAIEARFAEEVA